MTGVWTVYGGNATVLEVDDASNGSSAPHARRRPGVCAGLMTTVEANGVTLGVEHFGDAAAPLVLLAGGPTMLSWPDALCEALARGGRHVVRYDLRDCGCVDHRQPQGSGVHAARSRSPRRRARPPGRVLGAHPRRNAARRSRPARRRPS